MRRVSAIAALLVAATVPGLAQFSLRATAGWEYIEAGEMNKVAESMNAEYRLLSPYQAAPYGPIHSSILLGMEACFGLAKRTSIGLGAAFFPGVFDRRAIYERDYTVYTRQYNIGVRVIPVTLSLYQSFAVKRWLDLFLSIGAGYYSAEIGHKDYLDANAGRTGTKTRYDFTSRTDAFGVHGGLGLEIKITPGWRFVLQGTYRSAKLTEITGDWTYFEQDSQGRTTSSSGTGQTLYYVEVQDGETVLYRLRFGAEPPPDVKLARKGTIDLTGVSAVLGFRYTFGKKDPNDGSLIFTIH